MTGRLVHRPRTEVGLDDDRPGRSSDRARSRRRSPIRAFRARRRSGAAAPRARRSGGRPPGAGQSRRPDPRPSGSCARGWGASTARIPRARRSWRPGRSGLSGRACRPPGARPRASDCTSPAPVPDARASLARAFPCRTARPRRRPRPPRRCSGERPARAAAGAVERRPAAHARPVPARACGRSLAVDRCPVDRGSCLGHGQGD